MKFFCLSFGTLLLAAGSLHAAHITPIDTIGEALPYCQDAELIAIDIDDTLIRYPYHVGSTSWFGEELSRAREENDWERFHHRAALCARSFSVIPMEDETVSIVHELQQGPGKVMGLTCREVEHPAYPDWVIKTHEQIDSIGIGFADTAPSIDLPDLPPGALYHKGLLITGWGRKGEVMEAFVSLLVPPPHRIVVIDDRYSDLKELQEAFERLNIEATLLWYRKSEEHAANYHSGVAAIQLAALEEEGVVLPNRVAEHLFKALQQVSYSEGGSWQAAPSNERCSTYRLNLRRTL